MYNQEVKERFLSECFGNQRLRNNHYSQLCDIGEYEERVDRDLAQMNPEEVKYALSFVEVLEYGTASNLLSFVKAYRTWCKKNDVFPDVYRGEGDISVDDIDYTAQFSRVIIRDELDLFETLKKNRGLDDGFPEVVALAFAWVGVDVDTMVKLRDSDVDLESGVIFDPSGEVLVKNVPPLILEILDRFSKCSEGSRDNGTGSYPVVKDYSLDLFLKRFCSPKTKSKMGEPISRNVVNRAVENLNRKYRAEGYPSRLTFGNVLRSGGLSRIYKLEQNGLDVSNRANADVVVKCYGQGKDYVKIMWQYRFYKKAFNL